MNDLDTKLNSSVSVSGITIIGHDGAIINASTSPDYLDANIHTDARVQLNAIGDAFAKSKVVTAESAVVTVSNTQLHHFGTGSAFRQCGQYHHLHRSD